MVVFDADRPVRRESVFRTDADCGAPNLTGEGAFRDVYSVMNAWGSNHGAFGYGHTGAQLITLASMLRIPVYMHNVAEERIFRPSAWHAFGTSGLEGADFRACGNFGPLYG